MLKSISLSAIFCVALLSANAQTLTMPPDVSQAYAKGTRSLSGKPGKKYWENHGRYNISVTIAPPDRTVSGVEEITYFNNSPDTLHSLNMKLIVNVHLSPGRSGVVDPKDGLKVDNIQVNGVKAAWDNSTATTTNQMVALSSPLMPHD